MTRSVQSSKITLGDLMWLVAVAAFAMLLLRVTVASVDNGYLRHVNAPSHHWKGPLGFRTPYYLFFTIVIGVPQILVASLVVVIRTLKTRRDSVIPPSHRPGFVLCLAAVVAGSFTFLIHASSLILRTGGFFYDQVLWSVVVLAILPNVGYMILGSWMVLAMNGHWVPVSSWLDRIGYALCAALVILVVLESVRLLLESGRLM